MSQKDSELHLSPAEAAGRLGVSVKALRLYEQRGLVAPLRSASGWRAYGPAQMAQLHQVLALKRLGLPLARIASLMAGHALGLDGVLKLQEQALGKEERRISRALALIRSARAQLARGQTLSIDDLATLTMETTLPAKPTPKELTEIFDPLIAKHYTQEELAQLRDRKFDQAEISREWESLFAEGRRLMAKGDTGSPEALSLARRWTELVGQFTQGNAALADSARRVWADVTDDPKAAAKLQVDRELFEFVGKVTANLKKTDEKPHGE